MLNDQLKRARKAAGKRTNKPTKPTPQNNDSYDAASTQTSAAKKLKSTNRWGFGRRTMRVRVRR